jgi:hypothetical protein
MFVVFSTSTSISGNLIIIGSSNGSGFRHTVAVSNGYRIAKRNFVFGATVRVNGLTTTNTNLATSIINYSPTSFTAGSLNGGTISESNSFSSFVSGGYTYIGKSESQVGFNGKFMEILIYDKVLTSAERQKVEGYLSWKWGIQNLLPLNHPYYSSGPIGDVQQNVKSNPSVPITISTALTPPTGLTFISATATSITFSFTNPPGTITSYTPYINGSVGVGSGNASSYTITGLTDGTTYTISISASTASSTSPKTPP